MSNVIELTDNDFASNIAQYDITLVFFYDPGCEHCRRFKPEFDKAASVLRSKGSPVKFAQINCKGAGQQVCRIYGVERFPTIKVFLHGHYVRDYDGPKTADGIIEFLE